MRESFPVVLTAEDFALLQNIADLPTELFPGAIEVVRRKLAATNVFFPPTSLTTSLRSTAAYGSA